MWMSRHGLRLVAPRSGQTMAGRRRRGVMPPHVCHVTNVHGLEVVGTFVHRWALRCVVLDMLFNLGIAII